MDLSIHNRALIRGLLAGAVVLASASACSRSDRTDTGRENTGAVTPDSASIQPTNTAVTPSADSAGISSNTDTSSSTSAAVRSPAPRSNTRTPQRSIRDSSAAGYRSMERDTATEPSTPRDTARATTDSTLAPRGESSVTPSDSAPMEVATPTAAADTAVSSQDVAVQDSAPGQVTATPSDSSVTPSDSSVEMAGAASTASNDTAAAQEMSADTAAAGYAEMARDTSAAPAQADSGVAIQAQMDTAGTDSTATEEASRIHPADSTTAVASADTVTESERIRPPEDSTETVGAVTTSETASADRTDEVGAAAISSGNVNAADAVALMTRQGAQCIVVDPETAQGVLVEMSDTPTTLNPCGLGSMVLSRIWTKKE